MSEEDIKQGWLLFLYLIGSAAIFVGVGIQFGKEYGFYLFGLANLFIVLKARGSKEKVCDE